MRFPKKFRKEERNPEPADVLPARSRLNCRDDGRYCVQPVGQIGELCRGVLFQDDVPSLMDFYQLCISRR
jgi:hypothetical protein